MSIKSSVKTIGIKAKLIIVFILIKVLPLLAIAWFSWNQLAVVVQKMGQSIEETTQDSQAMSSKIIELATADSIKALDEKSRESIERLAADTAHNVARFLQERDLDILDAATLEPTLEKYQDFLKTKHTSVTRHPAFELNASGDGWVPSNEDVQSQEIIRARNSNNETAFHYLPPATKNNLIKKPLYLEMTFVDLSGQEKVKVTTSDIVDKKLQDISNSENTFCKAEKYFHHLKNLQSGEIYVSEVIGAYQKTDLIGTYSKARAEKAGIPFTPEDSGYAGKENPVGKRFEGLVRWAIPVESKGEIVGYVTLALDHEHIMEFTDYTIPTEERYSMISDAGSGNYTFMWDFLGRNISHPRDYFITGYDPETGEPALPWLEKQHYEEWLTSEKTTGSFLESLPLFADQSLSKKPSKEQTRAGNVGLDCRYLNFAPQCDGWMNLTQHGGSGSFLIFWSGLWKLTTAATIPYYTGQYADSPRGFGFVTIGANVDEFHKAAVTTSEKIKKIGETHIETLDHQFVQNQLFLKKVFKETASKLTLSTILMSIIVILIAIWMATALTQRITKIVKAIRLFQGGEFEKRLVVEPGDELDELGHTFNIMADNIQQSMVDLNYAYRESEKSNKRMVEEIAIREEAERKLSEHLENLEEIIAFRTKKLEEEILERKQAIQDLKQTQLQLVHSEKLAGIGQLAAGIAHEINTPVQYIGDNVIFFKESFNDLEEYLERCDTLLEDIENISTDLLTEKVAEYKEEFDLDFIKDEVPNSINQTLEGINRVADIVRSMKEFSHPGLKEKTIVDLNKAIQNTITVSRNEWKYWANIETNLDPELPKVFCLAGEINQVFLNLVTNASHAIKESVEDTDQGKGIILIESKKRDDHVQISFKDSGAGIPEEIGKKVFEPFFTTKDVGEGTGQGLAICWSIVVEQHNGEIWFESDSAGTSFYVSLPVNDDLIEH